MTSDLPFFVLRSTIPQQITSSTRMKDLPCCFASLDPVETQKTEKSGHRPSGLDPKEEYMQMKCTQKKIIKKLIMKYLVFLRKIRGKTHYEAMLSFVLIP